jgi:hypothetical protein
MDQTVLFSDGRAFHADTLGGPTPDPKDLRAFAAQSVEFLNTVAFPIWIEDSRFVLGQIEALDRAPGPFRGRLDLDRIGMLGWSFGGAAAIEMLRIDPRVKAAVNHDGRLFGGAATRPVTRPFMLFHHGADNAATAPEANRALVREQAALIRGIDSTARALATADWYDVTIEKTNHGHFSDLPLFLALFQDTTLLAGRRYYDCDMAGFSIPAAEHSTITGWGRERESDAYRNMVAQFGKSPPTSARQSANGYRRCTARSAPRFVGGFYGQLVSGVLCLASASLATWSTPARHHDTGGGRISHFPDH